MSKSIDFKLVSGGIRTPEGMEIKPLTPRYADNMVELYGGIGEEDLRSNGLDPRLSGAYADRVSATARLQDLRESTESKRPIGAFAIMDRPDTTAPGVGDIHGVAVFARETVTHAGRVRRAIAHLVDEDDGARLFTSWLKQNPNEPHEYINPGTVMDESLNLASTIGLSAVRIAVVQGLAHPSDKLTVVEHAIVPAVHGFVEVGPGTVTVEGIGYDSVIYQRDLS